MGNTHYIHINHAYNSKVAKNAHTIFAGYSSTTSNSDNNSDIDDLMSYDSGIVIRIWVIRSSVVIKNNQSINNLNARRNVAVKWPI